MSHRSESRPPRIWGIINATPDSFSDGGKYESTERAIEHGLRLIREGADVLDVGGESTRPGAQEVPVEVEIDRVCPVIVGLREAGVTAPLSIDTRHSAVAQAALDAGASIVNDVSAGHDPSMFEIVAKAGADVVLMHMRGTPETMQESVSYDNVVVEVRSFLKSRVNVAMRVGVPARSIWLDPGIGFGKTLEHNIDLLRALPELRNMGQRVLLGTSRKSFLGTLAGGRPPTDRLPGSLATVAHACLAGIDAVRVHDVGATHDFIVTYQAIEGPNQT